MESRTERVLSIVMTAATVVIAAAFVKREFDSPARAVAHQGEPTEVREWPRMLRNGTVVGSTNAPVVVAVFSDYECGFCKLFLEQTFTPIAREFPGKVSMVVIDFPITGHRFARPAARAASCAKDQGKFPEYMYALFAGQQSFGIRPWDSYASEAGVVDIATFVQCASQTASLAQTDSGLALARELGVKGTPTVVINGWRFPLSPMADDLRAAVQNVLDGKPPFEDWKAGPRG